MFGINRQTKTTFYCVIFLIATIIALCSIRATNFHNKMKVAIVYITFILPHIMTMWETVLIITLTRNIKYKFLIINTLIHNQTQILINLKKVLSVNKLQTGIKFVNQENVCIVKRINTIMETYYHLTGLSMQINELFGCPILFVMGVNFGIITFCVYSFMNEIDITTPLDPDMIGALLWFIILNGEIFWIICTFQAVEHEVND